MPASPLIETRFLILRKTPYSESSLVLAGMSPDQGQLHFLVRGARKLGKRQFPMADLFRACRIKYTPARKGSLHTWCAADLEGDFTGVAKAMATYNAASWLARFTLLNVSGEMAMARFYTALEVALGRLSEAAADSTIDRATVCDCVIVGAGLVFLDESGLLSDYEGRPEQRARRDMLLDMAEGRTAPPVLQTQDWHRLRSWMEQLLHRHDCQVPQ